MSDVTRLLGAIQQGEPKAAEELLPLVYQELRQLAAARVAKSGWLIGCVALAFPQ